MPGSDDRRSGGGRWSVAATCGALAAAEVLIAVLAYREAAGMGVLLALHAAVVAVILCGLVLANAYGRNSLQLHLSALLVAGLGPLGLAGAAVITVMRGWNAGRTVPFADWHAAFFAEPPRDRVADLHAHLVRCGPSACGNGSVASFRDAMATGTIARKQAVLGLIADHFEPAYAPVLRTALNDEEAVIRVQAASVAARIEDDFLQRGNLLRAAVQGGEAGARERLAAYYEACAGAGLADEFTAQSLRRLALDMLGDDPAALAARARLLLHLGDSEAAADLLREPLAREDADPGLALLLLEALMRRGAFAEMRLIARRFAGRTDGDALPALSLWSASARRPGGAA